MPECVFSKLPDDVVLNILYKLEDDPRHWPRIACVSTKFSSLIRTVCFKTKCTQSIPSIVSDLLPSATSADSPDGGWASLYKLSVCCPGVSFSGVLLENSDFGLERDIGSDENYQVSTLNRSNESKKVSSSSSVAADCAWSLYDDLLFDTLYNDSELSSEERAEVPEAQPGIRKKKRAKADLTICNTSKICRSLRSHLASGVWNLSREQGNKLLASRFKGDCLYICDWPGCVHVEEKRNYMLFRGIFKNFKQSSVWRTVNDGNRSKVDLNCAFCASKETWDLHSSFCLRRYFGYHDDGDPVVRAYVCENGHVSGAWTDWPLYT